ncbi:MAG: hypothetical protein CDV28_1684 [Candidatus Electronema aureum]|uniref:Uncharacterized protein n=1 Tax=Candidatus Electronema aureum TaxID=2005002 RepID=A0A521FY66_9BACT|nr:MAG: hypothetical protein CDV28_1684 [Candidatus Electronema aureum]
MTDQEQPKRGRGRPKQYASDADRARAWRQRQAELIAQAQQPVAPVVIEKIVEKVVEIPVDRRIQENSPKPGRSKAAGSTPDATRLASVLKPKFGAYGGEERAKRLRVNAARAASTAREILGMFGAGEAIPEAEKAFLQQAAQFFEGLNGLFETSQHSARQAKTRADAERQAKHNAKLAEVVRLTFGETLDQEQVRATAEALQAFASSETGAAEARRRRVDRSYFFINREYELKAALKAGDPQQIAREVAEIRLDAGERGRFWNDREERCYSAGWADFLEFRSNEKR